ncbi:MAG: Ig-like domain-containing protein [Lachnospiraceae bacterium]|nr:Ig-like domain-containing protein [Lachnospiraceae bacterium]
MKRHKIGALILAFIMVAGAFGSEGFSPYVYASGSFKKTADNTRLGVGEISGPEKFTKNESRWRGSYVYYGKFRPEGSSLTYPVRYCVLDPDSHEYGVSGGSLFLDCDTMLTDMYYDKATPYDWKHSIVYEWLNGTFRDTSFTGGEKNAIARSVKTSPTTYPVLKADDMKPYISDKGTLLPFAKLKESDDNYCFLLDRTEMGNAYYSYYNPYEDEYRMKRMITDTDKKGDTTEWWLRSHFPEGSEDNAQAMYVTNMGEFDYEDMGTPRYGVSPALNIARSSVIFSSLVNGKDEYKLTVRDAGITADIKKGVTRKGNEILIPYTLSGPNAGSVNRLSAIVTDGTWNDETGWSDGARILQYAKLSTISTAKGDIGSGSFKLDKSLRKKVPGKDYQIYLIAESIAGDCDGVEARYRTDYASKPVKVNKIEKNDVKRVYVTPSLSLSVGKQKTLKATVFPKNAKNTGVIWTSSKPGVAEIDSSGVLTAKKAGKTTITATSMVGRSKRTCKVTVKPKKSKTKAT